MISHGLVWVALLCAIGPTDSKAENPTLSRVRIQVTDSYGHPVRGAHIRISGPSVDLDATGRDVLDLQTGTYTIVADLPGFNTFRSIEVIDQPNQILSIAMRLGAYEASAVSCSIEGHTEPRQIDARVRLVPLFGTGVRDAPILAKGSFQFRGVECGSYVLIVTRQAECIGVAFPLATTQSRQVLVPVGQQPCGDVLAAPRDTPERGRSR